MSEDSPTIEERIHALENETEVLVARLLALATDLARKSYWKYLPAAMSAVEHVEAARQALSNSRHPGKPDPGTGPINPTPTGGGETKA